MGVVLLEILQVITHLGAASLMVPFLAVLVVGLWRAGQPRGLRVWLPALVACLLLVLTTKIAFLGWGFGSASLDFTGISGHTTLASSILPVWLGWMLSGGGQRISVRGVLLGLVLGALVGLSRVVLGAHSTSEVIIGWLFGAGLSWLAYRVLSGATPMPWHTRSAALLLLCVFKAGLSNYLPSHTWEVQAALFLSSRGHPHTRYELHHSSVEDVSLRCQTPRNREQFASDFGQLEHGSLSKRRIADLDTQPLPPPESWRPDR